MNIVVAVKVVPDDQDIQVTAAGELDMSKAHQAISAYDLNAIEAAAQLAAAAGDSTVSVVTVGGSAIDDSKLKKNILASKLCKASLRLDSLKLSGRLPADTLALAVDALTLDSESVSIV